MDIHTSATKAFQIQGQIGNTHFFQDCQDFFFPFQNHREGSSIHLQTGNLAMDTDADVFEA